MRAQYDIKLNSEQITFHIANVSCRHDFMNFACFKFTISYDSQMFTDLTAENSVITNIANKLRLS